MDGQTALWKPIAALIGWALAIALVIALVIGLIFGGVVSCKAISRTQRRADARNSVQVTKIKIGQAAQQVLVQDQLANVRAAEADGIRRAQDKINKTLTPLYIQHEAITAQLAMANSKNHTVIWAPSGANGVPLVSTIDLQSIANPPTGGGK